MFSIKTEVTITAQQIADQFTTIIESGQADWLHRLMLAEPSPESMKTEEGFEWYANPTLFTRDDFVIVAFYDDPDKDEEGDGTGRFTINQEAIKIGMGRMAVNSPTSFHDLAQDNGDAWTADCLLQHIIFGETVYA